MTTAKRNRRSPRLASSRADELIYAITLAMARRQMRRNWGYQFPSWDEVAGALQNSNAVRAHAAL
jgi:hypothetical protein